MAKAKKPTKKTVKRPVVKKKATEPAVKPAAAPKPKAPSKNEAEILSLQQNLEESKASNNWARKELKLLLGRLIVMEKCLNDVKEQKTAITAQLHYYMRKANE